MTTKPIYRSGRFTRSIMGNYGFGIKYTPIERLLYRALGFLICNIGPFERADRREAVVLMAIGDPGQHSALTLPLYHEEKLELILFRTRRYDRTHVDIKLAVHDESPLTRLVDRADRMGTEVHDLSVLILPK